MGKKPKVLVFIQLLGVIVLDLVVLTLFPALLVGAAAGDLLTFRIPNWVSIAVVALFVPAAVLAGFDWTQAGLHAALALCLLAGGMGLFAMGLLGGGDAKLLAATGLWMGWGALPAYLVWAALIGGVLAAMVLLFRKMPLAGIEGRAAWIGRLHDRQQGIPYGIALAGGALMALPQTIWFDRLATSF